LTNVVLQPVLLALSLLSVDDHANVMPPVVAVVLAVAGVAILAVVVAGLVIRAQSGWANFRRALREEVDSSSLHSGSAAEQTE